MKRNPRDRHTRMMMADWSSLSPQQQRLALDARRRLLVGSVLAASDQEQCVEATFATHFAAHVREPRFWPAFEQACCAAYEDQSWHLPRQLMIAFSLPQEINAKDERVRPS